MYLMSANDTCTLSDDPSLPPPPPLHPPPLQQVKMKYPPNQKNPEDASHFMLPPLKVG